MIALVLSLVHSATGPVAQAARPYVQRRQVAGLVFSVSDRTHSLATECVGFADVAAHRPMRPDAVFWIASMTKPVTAAAVMMLVDAGRIGLDDPVSKFVPEFGDVWVRTEADEKHELLRRPLRAITIRDLLRNTGGVVPFYAPASTITDLPFTILPLRVAARAYAATPLLFDPGERWSYSTGGFTTLGRVVEVVSRMPYDAFVQRRILDPLGMRDTTFSPDRRLLARLAKSYETDAAFTRLTEFPILTEPQPMRPGRRLPEPAGGLYSTAADVTRFGQMLLNGGAFRGRRLLSAAAVREMTREQVPASKGASYGFGLFTNPDGSYGHNGVYGTIFTVCPREGRVLVILMQSATIQRYGPQSLYDAVYGASQKAYGTGPKP